MIDLLGEWFSTLNNLFVNDIFGSSFLFSLAIIIFLSYMAFKKGAGFTTIGVGIFFFVLLAAGYSLQNWLVIPMIMMALFIVAFALLRIGRR